MSTETTQLPAATADDCVEIANVLVALGVIVAPGRKFKIGLAPLGKYQSTCNVKKRTIDIGEGVSAELLMELIAHQMIHVTGTEGHGAPFTKRLLRAADRVERRARNGELPGPLVSGALAVAQLLRAHAAEVASGQRLFRKLDRVTKQYRTLIAEPMAKALAPNKEPATTTPPMARASFERVRAAAFPRWSADGWKVRVRSIRGAVGRCDIPKMTIVIAPDVKPRALDVVMAHEIAHAVVGPGHGAPFRRALVRASERAASNGKKVLARRLLAEARLAPDLEAMPQKIEESSESFQALIREAEKVHYVCLDR